MCKRLWYSATTLTLAMVLFTSAHAAELKINFEDPDSYSDLTPALETRERFKERTLEGVEEIFREFAGRLPDDQELHVTVTDIKLAGFVQPVQRGGSLEQMRVVTNSHPPAMEFSYRLYDAQGELLQEGDERLRGRSSADMVRRGGRADHEFLRYERMMLDRWFRSTFE